jgi:hypothetical protein
MPEEPKPFDRDVTVDPETRVIRQPPDLLEKRSNGMNSIR